MMPKRMLAALAVCLMALTAVSHAETVVTSFYPIYLFALNLCHGLEGVEVRNLAAPDFGCLHDYQLTVADMKALSRADVFLINGAGMEEYLTHIYDALPGLKVVDASDHAAEVELLDDDGLPAEHHDDKREHEDEEDEDHEHDHRGEDAHGHHHDVNPHIWMSVPNAEIMVSNLAAGLIETMPDREAAILKNRDAFLARLAALDGELRSGTADLARRDIVTFHEAFPYFAHAYGIRVAAVMAVEPGDALSARDMIDLIAEERELGNPPLFTEPQYVSRIAPTLAAETGASIYTLDPCVTGPEDPPLTWYEDVMRANLASLREALGAEEPR